jgi:hypothetical protein
MVKPAQSSNGEDPAPAEQPVCGIVMPISAIEDCTAAHWAEVHDIVQSAAEMAGFKGSLVSAADYSGIILRQIVQNLYENPIVVCDVSARNPNVMFELGLRLAFDKPTILIKDDKTNYAFDTSPIEHLEYPRGFRYATMVDFRTKLADKILATHKQATTDRDYTTFLKHFGSFKVATVETKEVSGMEFILKELGEIRSQLGHISTIEARINRSTEGYNPYSNFLKSYRGDQFILRGDVDKVDEAMKRIRSLPEKNIKTMRGRDGSALILVPQGEAKMYEKIFSDIADGFGVKLFGLHQG